MKLYYSDVLSPRKACAVAKYLKAPVEFIYLDLTKGEQRTPAYLALNPNAKVPTLVDGDRVLWPKDSQRQLDIIRWFSWDAMHFGRAAGALYFQHIIKPRFRIGPPDPAAVESALVEFHRYAAVLDRHLDGRQWLVGDGLTVADFCVAVTLPYARQASMPLDAFPHVRRWHDRLNEFEAWRDPFPERDRTPKTA